MKSPIKIVIFLAITLLLIVVLFFVKNNKPIAEAPVVNNQTTVSESSSELPQQNQSLCFSKDFHKDITTVTLTLSGDTVTGTMDWVPFEKDSARGTLSGTIENGEMHLLYDYMIEGAHQTEEKIMKIQDRKLLIKHGELLDPKYNGNLIYKDVSSAVYNETLEPC